MKKIITFALVATFIMGLSTVAFATETEETMQRPQMQKIEMSQDMEEKMAELEVLAEEAGMTVEEYIAANCDGLGMGMQGGMGQKMQKQGIEETTELDEEAMETKKAEMETLKEEKMAELETLAEEAGMTVEEYTEANRESKETPEAPELDEEAMEAKKAEMETLKEEKMAELETLAEEAGMTVEEYIAANFAGQGMGMQSGMSQGMGMQGGMGQGRK